MRYRLHDYLGRLIAEAETAQGIADKATPGTFSIDTLSPRGNRCTVWREDPMGLLGVPGYTRLGAMRECAIIALRSQP